MLTDYKFWYIRRDDNGFITEAAIRFYEGEMQDVIEDGQTVNRYVRTKRLAPDETPHKDKPKVKESSGADAILYTPSDFGQIKTDDELREFMKNEIAKDKDREVIKEQK